jgi:porin
MKNILLSLFVVLLYLQSGIAQELPSTPLAVVEDPGKPTGEATESAQSDQQTPPSNEIDGRLTGNWMGLRSSLEESGISFGFMFRGDQGANLSGGAQRGTGYLHNIDATFSIDAEKFLGWNGANLFVHVMSNNGGTLNRYVGDVQMTSNIEAKRVTKLYQAWVDQSMFSGSASLLIGLYDLNSEFYATRSAALFLNGSFGVGKEFSQTGANGPSIFPNTALAMRVRFSPSKEWYVQAAALDGQPGLPGDPFSPAIHLSAEEGALIVGEVGHVSNADQVYGKIGVGAWYYTAPTDEIGTDESSESAESNNWGVFLHADQVILPSSSDPNAGLAAFARLGFASKSINQFDNNLALGLVWTASSGTAVPGDQIGLAFSTAHVSPFFETAALNSGGRMEAAESTLEGCYRHSLLPWLITMADIQYVIHPSAQQGRASACIAVLRLEVHI